MEELVFTFNGLGVPVAFTIYSMLLVAAGILVASGGGCDDGGGSAVIITIAGVAVLLGTIIIDLERVNLNKFMHQLHLKKAVSRTVNPKTGKIKYVLQCIKPTEPKAEKEEVTKKEVINE